LPAPAANWLRGAIGCRLHQLGDGAYEAFFAPRSAAGPSGLADPPRPFVIRAHPLDGVRLQAGEPFGFDLHVFDFRRPWVELLAEVCKTLPGSRLMSVEAREIEAPLSAGSDPVGQLRVRFLTPTELKAGGRLLHRPEFAVLLARIRDRISTLSALYGSGPLPLDFAAFGDRAAAVKMTSCEVRRVSAERTSRRTGQIHPLGGFVGEASYAGALAEFAPFLRVAQWTGVGRQTTWGKGAVQLID
jgi:hypothetical protein